MFILKEFNWINKQLLSTANAKDTQTIMLQIALKLQGIMDL